jgi:hypothetical protein
MAWQPEQEALGQLSNCLKNSLSGHNKAAQKEAEIVRSPELRCLRRCYNSLEIVILA